MGYAVLRVRALMLQGVPIQPWKGFGLWAFGARLAEGFRHFAGSVPSTQFFEVPQMRLGNVPVGAFPPAL